MAWAQHGVCCHASNSVSLQAQKQTSWCTKICKEILKISVPIYDSDEDERDARWWRKPQN